MIRKDYSFIVGFLILEFLSSILGFFIAEHRPFSEFSPLVAFSLAYGILFISLIFIVIGTAFIIEGWRFINDKDY